jgi:hypothetical protein
VLNMVKHLTYEEVMENPVALSKWMPCTALILEATELGMPIEQYIKFNSLQEKKKFKNKEENRVSDVIKSQIIDIFSKLNDQELVNTPIKSLLEVEGIFTDRNITAYAKYIRNKILAQRKIKEVLLLTSTK